MFLALAYIYIDSSSCVWSQFNFTWNRCEYSSCRSGWRGRKHTQQTTSVSITPPMHRRLDHCCTFFPRPSLILQALAMLSAENNVDTIILLFDTLLLCRRANTCSDALKVFLPHSRNYPPLAACNRRSNDSPQQYVESPPQRPGRILVSAPCVGRYGPS